MGPLLEKLQRGSPYGRQTLRRWPLTKPNSDGLGISKKRGWQQLAHFDEERQGDPLADNAATPSTASASPHGSSRPQGAGETTPSRRRLCDRKPWRAWLEANFDTAIWLVYPNKASGEPRIVYNDAVEEALCFGWIDSIIKKLDSLHAVQRFTPRKRKGGYSQQNKERLRWLADEGLLHPSVRESVQDVLDEEYVFPEDILAAVRANDRAWEHFQGFSPAYRRIRVAYIDNARTRPEVYQSRLKNFIRATEQGKQIGYGGIEKYF